MEVTVEESIDNSIASEFRNVKCRICYIPMKRVEQIRSSKDYNGYKKFYYNHIIGARFYPANNNENQTTEYIQFKDSNYDAFILFKKSTASNLIKDE